MTAASESLTVAVTGPTGTFGSGLLPLLEASEQVGRVVGIARRPFDPATRGWTKLDYRQGDVRDADALAAAFAGADVVVHLAFIVTGAGGREAVRAINVEGTLNVVRAAAAAGVRRVVYASSIAAYGFFADNPVGMTEDQPIRRADHLFYAQEKAELEQLLAEEPAAAGVELYLLRPPVVVGPHALGGKVALPGWLEAAIRQVTAGLGRSPVPLPVPVYPFELQFIHEDDVGQALLLCVLGAGPPGAYNVAGDGVVTLADLAREAGLTPVRVIPRGLGQGAAKLVAGLPGLPAPLEWAEAGAAPAIMDITRARELLGFRPAYSGLEAIRDTFAQGLRTGGS